jgi:hypothetical protein
MDTKTSPTHPTEGPTITGQAATETSGSAPSATAGVASCSKLSPRLQEVVRSADRVRAARNLNLYMDDGLIDVAIRTQPLPSGKIPEDISDTYLLKNARYVPAEKNEHILASIDPEFLCRLSSDRRVLWIDGLTLSFPNDP